MADVIGDAQLRPWLKSHGWDLMNDGLERDWEFADFAAALAFVNAVGGLAEAQGHHPDITLHDYNLVRLRLRTHSADGVTAHDLELAERVDELQEQ